MGGNFALSNKSLFFAGYGCRFIAGANIFENRLQLWENYTESIGRRRLLGSRQQFRFSGSGFDQKETLPRSRLPHFESFSVTTSVLEVVVRLRENGTPRFNAKVLYAVLILLVAGCNGVLVRQPERRAPPECGTECGREQEYVVGKIVQFQCISSSSTGLQIRGHLLVVILWVLVTVLLAHVVNRV